MHKTIIVAKPGRLRDGLHSLVVALPHVEVIGLASDGHSALAMAKEHQPSLILLDSSLPESEVFSIIREIKAITTQTRCILLAEKTQQYQPAMQTGVDEVLFRGFTAAELFGAIQQSLSHLEEV